MNYVPKPEFPRPEFERKKWQNLNGDWEFKLFPVGSEKQEQDFAQSRESYLLHITVPFSWSCPLSGVGQDAAGVGWYRRTVNFSSEGSVFLCFGAVDYGCDVFINGQHAGNHNGGYTYFEFDITPYWKTGANLIEVRTEDYRQSFQTMGKQIYGSIQGIWQTVWLEERPSTYIRSLRFVTKCSGSVKLEADICSPALQSVTLTAEFGGKQFTVFEEPERGIATVELNISVDNPLLWTPDDPNLYYGSVTLSSIEGTDQVGTYFGIREIGFAAFGNRDFPWITINGNPVYISGTLDQAFYPNGYFTCPSDEEMQLDVWRLKRLGLNMVRIHIKPEEPRKLYHLDRMGVLVMEDMPCFWGNPDLKAREAYEQEWREVLFRDYNHPSIFSWVMFNETWGLFTGGEKDFLPSTQEWLTAVYHEAKEVDPTRLIEDNSPCNYDHVITDINSWHFYINGYKLVRNHIRNVVDNTFTGSLFNHTGGTKQRFVPLMNSECGMVWGVDGSAGDSDLAWQYHYMLNEFRLHEKICGFVFTEFRDVVNEFNGYYRIDGRDKNWGYDFFCKDMSHKDLHAADFLAIDAPPCQTVRAGEKISVPLVISSFCDSYHKEGLCIFWSLWYDGIDGKRSVDHGTMQTGKFGYGTTGLGTLEISMPDENALAICSFYLINKKDGIVSRNFVTFDVRSNDDRCTIAVPLLSCTVNTFPVSWYALAGEKLSCGGSGEIIFDVDIPDELCSQSDQIELIFEAGAKRVLKKDIENQEPDKDPLDFFLQEGCMVDRGAFKNSYWMTDEEQFTSAVKVIIDGVEVADIVLENDPADGRGVLSWHAQPDDRVLEEAGSYGFLHRIEIPSRIVWKIKEQKRTQIMFRVDAAGGLALYGRHCGRYATDMVLRFK